MPTPPVKVQRPLSRTTRSGKVAPAKFTPSHAFQGSQTRAAVKQSQELPMPTGAPTGSFAPPPAPDLLSSIPELSSPPIQTGAMPQPGMPAHPSDVISPPPAPGVASQIPDGKTLMQPTTPWLSQNRFIPNATASARANKGVMVGKPPSGPRAPIPLGPVPGPVGPPPSPGGAEPGGAAAVLAKQGKAQTPLEFGKRAMLLPAAIGAGIGATRAPSGKKGEGAGRGVMAGMMTDAGAGLGGLGGLLAGAGAGVGLDKAFGPNVGNIAIPGLAIAGGVGGMALGGYGGLRFAQKAMGKPSWQRGAEEAPGRYEKAITPKPKTEEKPKPKAKAAPSGDEKQSAAFNFGTDIAKHIKPKTKTVTRTESTHRGADMKKGLQSAC